MSNKRQKLDTELLRIRNQINLEKVKESAKLLSNKYGSSDPVIKLIEAEIDFELYLLEHEPRGGNVTIAQKELTSVKKTFQELQKSDCKSTLFQVPEEASLLLAKVEYSQGNHTSCLEIYHAIHLSPPKSLVPMYKLKMFSEAFAIKALCWELELSKSSQQEAMLNKIIDCYENSTQFLLKYLKELSIGISAHSMNPEDNIVGFFSEIAVLRCAVLYLKKDNLWKGVKYLRQVFKTMHSLLPIRMQQVLSCKLAMILLRGTSSEDYRIEKNADSPSNDFSFVSEDQDLESQVDSNLLANSSTQSKKFFLGEKKYNPTCVEQEVILLLLISEIMLNIDPVLDMSPEHAESREETLCSAEALYNMLTVVCAYLGQFDLLSTAIEKSLKYSFDRHHIWQQFALSLGLAGKKTQALPCFVECCNVKPDDPCSALMAAKLCYEQFQPQLDEGLQFAQLALKMSDECFNNNDGMKSRSHLCVGVGLSLKAVYSKCSRECAALHTSAMASYAQACSADPYDHTALSYFAYELALMRKLPSALKNIKGALSLQPEDKFSLHLLALLLTAVNQYAEAKQTLDEAIKMYPDDVGLLATKCKLMLHTGDENEALLSCDELMKQWTSVAEASHAQVVDAGLDLMTNDGLSVANASFGAEIETASVFAGSIVASRYGPTLSDVTSSLADLQPKLAALSSTRTEAWLQVADVYLSLGRYDEAESCVSEAVQINPLLPSVLYMRGRLLDHRRELTEACNMYNNALIIDPFHKNSTEYLAKVLCCQGKYGFAKKLVQDALIQDINSHAMWGLLADILEHEGDIESAIECSSFALKLKETAPVIPFSTLIPSL